MDQRTGQLLCIKEITLHDVDQKLLESLVTEFESLQQVDRKLLVPYLDLLVTDKRIVIVQLLMSGENLTNFFKKFFSRSTTLPIGVVQGYYTKVLESLQYLHSLNIVHGNLKGGNVFLSTSGSVVLGDYGLPSLNLILAHLEWNVVHKPRDQYSHVKLSSFAWSAPEVILVNTPASAKSDIWSVGCLLREFITGRPPLVSENQIEDVYWLKCFENWLAIYSKERSTQESVEMLLGKEILSMTQETRDVLFLCCNV